MQEMSRDDAFDRVYKAMNRVLSLPQIYAGITIAIGLIALIVTLGAILQPMPALTRVTIIVTAVVFWLFTGISFNFWRKWRVVYAWKQDREALELKSERVKAYLAKADEGKIPSDIRQDLQDLLEAFHREWQD